MVMGLFWEGLIFGVIQCRRDENLGNEELSHDDVNHCSTFKIIVLG